MTKEELLNHKVDSAVKLMQQNAKNFGILLQNFKFDLENIKNGKNLAITNALLSKKIDTFMNKQKQSDIENARLKREFSDMEKIVQELQAKIKQLEEEKNARHETKEA